MKKILCAVLILTLLLPAFAMAQEIGFAVENAVITFNDEDTFALTPRLFVHTDAGKTYYALASDEDVYLDVAYVLTDDGFALLFPSMSKSGFAISLSKLFEELEADMKMIREDLGIGKSADFMEYYRKMLDGSIAQDVGKMENAIENAFASVINYAFPETGDYTVTFEPDDEQALQIVMKLVEEMYDVDLAKLAEAEGISHEEDLLSLLEEEGFDFPIDLKVELSRTNGVFAYGLDMDVAEDEDNRIHAAVQYRFAGEAGFCANVAADVVIEGFSAAEMRMELGEDGKGGISMDIRTPDAIAEGADGIPDGEFGSLHMTADLVPYTGVDPVGPIEDYKLFDIFDIALGDPDDIPADLVLALAGLELGFTNRFKEIRNEESIAALAAYFTPETEQTADTDTPDYGTKVTLRDGSLFVPELPEELGMHAEQATIEFWEDGICDIYVTLRSGTDTITLGIGLQNGEQYVVTDGEVRRIEAPDWYIRVMEYAVICSNDKMSVSFVFDDGNMPSIEEIIAILSAVHMPEYEELKRIAEEEKSAAAAEQREARKTAEKSGQGKKKSN